MLRVDSRRKRVCLQGEKNDTNLDTVLGDKFCHQRDTTIRNMENNRRLFRFDWASSCIAIVYDPSYISSVCMVYI
jgi:hypothetical protein